MTEETEVEGDRIFLLETLDACKTKLQVYRAHSDGLYYGGMEHSALIRRIEQAHKILSTEDNATDKLPLMERAIRAGEYAPCSAPEPTPVPTNVGWLCPRCGRGNAPTCMTCLCVPVEYKVTC